MRSSFASIAPIAVVARAIGFVQLDRRRGHSKRFFFWLTIC